MPKKVRLGIWTVDFAARQLSSGSVRATVSCRAIDVLRDLVAAGTATLSREALLDSVWADVIVTDESLTKAISELRRVFRRAEHESDIIETVPRTGYRLLVEPAEVETGVPPPVPAGLLSLEAYALVLEAEMALIRGDSGDIADAVACSGEALRIAPDSAAANSAHAHALTVRALYGSGGPDDLRQALHCAERAVSGTKTSLTAVATRPVNPRSTSRPARSVAFTSLRSPLRMMIIEKLRFLMIEHEIGHATGQSRGQQKPVPIETIGIDPAADLAHFWQVIGKSRAQIDADLQHFGLAETGVERIGRAQ